MPTQSAKVDLSKIIAYENGELTQQETIDLFQSLVDSGLVWQLQGSYGRAAKRMLELGIIVSPMSKEDDTKHFGPDD